MILVNKILDFFKLLVEFGIELAKFEHWANKSNKKLARFQSSTRNSE